MFVGIQSGVTGKDAVVGESAHVSKATDAAKAATEIAKAFGLSGDVELRPHATRTYHNGVAIGGNIAFRLLNVEGAPKGKIPAGI